MSFLRQQQPTNENVNTVVECLNCSREVATATLAAYGNDVQRAIEWLLNHNNQPPPQNPARLQPVPPRPEEVHHPSARMQQLLERQHPGNANLRHELYERCMDQGKSKQQDVGECESWVGLFKIALLFIASFVVQPYCLSGASYC
jgi:hypothetical protein